MYAIILILSIIVFIGLITGLFLDISIHRNGIDLKGNWIYKKIFDRFVIIYDAIRYFYYTQIKNYAPLELGSREAMWGFEEGDVINLGIGENKSKKMIIMRYKTKMVIKDYE